jgi:hypothetical protein
VSANEMSVDWTVQSGLLLRCNKLLFLLTCPAKIGVCNGLPIVTELKDEGQLSVPRAFGVALCCGQMICFAQHSYNVLVALARLTLAVS